MSVGCEHVVLYPKQTRKHSA